MAAAAAAATLLPYLLFAAVDLPLLLCRQGEHGFPVLLREVELILHGGGGKKNDRREGESAHRRRLNSATERLS